MVGLGAETKQPSSNSLHLLNDLDTRLSPPRKNSLEQENDRGLGREAGEDFAALVHSNRTGKFSEGPETELQSLLWIDCIPLKYVDVLTHSSPELTLFGNKILAGGLSYVR